MTALLSCAKALGLGLCLIVVLVCFWQLTESVIRNRRRAGR